MSLPLQITHGLIVVQSRPLVGQLQGTFKLYYLL